MSSTTAPTLFPGESPEVLGLGAEETRAFLAEQQRLEDQAAARKLRAVTHWADLHRTSEVVGAIDPVMRELQDQPLLGREGQLRLAGEGAFTVEEFAVCEIAATLGMSEPAARGYLGQALELRDRLPRLWATVMAGELPAWKGRQIAQETIPLTAAAATYVDTHLAPFAARLSLARILRAVSDAVLRHDPGVAAERAERAADRRGVWLEDHLDGTTTLTALTGTPDAAALDTALTQVAGTLAALGDTDRDQVRRAKALGILADPQYALDLTATASGSATGREPRPRSTQGPTIHIHLHTDALTGTTGSRGSGGTGGVSRIERFGPRSVEAVQRWLADLAPGATVKVTPVIDLGEQISVDAYEIPDRLRTQIAERDPGCRFPWCGRTGAFDLDHIDPYRPPDDGGPPGQTNTHNLARLCRFHHRVKTHTDWHYHREPNGTLRWTSPLGRHYTVDEHGTLPHP